MKNKVCKSCKQEKPANFSFYYKGPTYKGKTYLSPKCKVCSDEYTRKNYSKYKDYRKSYIKNNPWVKEQIKSKATEVQGVYGLYDKGVCLYVGESSWLNHRLYLHKSYTRKPNNSKSQKGLYEILNQNHPNFICGIIEECDNHKEREKYYINKLKPLYNE